MNAEENGVNDTFDRGNENNLVVHPPHQDDFNRSSLMNRSSVIPLGTEAKLVDRLDASGDVEMTNMNDP